MLTCPSMFVHSTIDASSQHPHLEHTDPYSFTPTLSHTHTHAHTYTDSFTFLKPCIHMLTHPYTVNQMHTVDPHRHPKTRFLGCPPF